MITVNIPGRPYDVLVQPGLLGRVGEVLPKLTQSRKVAVVTMLGDATFHRERLARLVIDEPTRDASPSTKPQYVSNPRRS